MTSSHTEPMRCKWAQSDPLLAAYHDTEWGVPETDARALWEKLMLDGFQAGLSWLTILKKREAFRRAFVDFDPARVARFDAADVDRLLADPGIVRSRAKIEAVVGNARAYLDMQAAGEDFADFVWSFVDHRVQQGDGHHVPTESEQSRALARALKRRGFKYVGPTIVYAWMQAVGMVNDHALECFCRDRV
ncbi:DNA-3-methyladenine glycosylase I [Salinisphaera hydrothermalis]|uniref:DNA-3-methyladenine glycosylase I n=1 Tax=Salinisphaera hydrothermalis (strain C41B8) TaxID=1304275 RepID=A0A084IG15_SALHC|nr:DNA-3-methyladenine glycosylase I [Salinisphaera hydrothermalis]KEZ75649.1 DNA-3-methyladenine glycosylase I [Salinisphaera hydrothermalis C41B8]